MHFAPDTEESLEFVVALANTDKTASRTGGDELDTVPALTALLVRHAYSGRIDRDEAELREVQQTRALLRRVWTLDRSDAVEQVNGMLRSAHALPYLIRHDGSDWHMHAAAAEAPLAERIRVEAALAFIDVIRMNESARLRLCEAEHCAGLILDLSRNGSKRFCSVRCGNRTNMVAFRERRAEAR